MGSKIARFPVFCRASGNSIAESGSHQTPSSATRSGFPPSQKTGKCRACLRPFFQLRGPEILSFGRELLIHTRFSLFRIEPVPFRTIICKKRPSPGHRLSACSSRT